MIRQKIAKLTQKSIKELQKEGVFQKFEIPEIRIEHPEEKIHGDYSTNVAMVIAKKVKKNPLEIARVLVNKLISLKVYKFYFERVEVAAPGFINFFLKKSVLINDAVSARFAKLSNLLTQINQNAPALEAIKHAVFLEPQNPKYLDKLVETSIMVGDKKEAKEAYDKLRLANPENSKLSSFKDQISELK